MPSPAASLGANSGISRFSADVTRHNRHGAACRWLAKGLDLRAIQLLLGHADLKATQRYLNVTDEELRRTMNEKLWSRRTAHG